MRGNTRDHNSDGLRSISRDMSFAVPGTSEKNIWKILTAVPRMGEIEVRTPCSPDLRFGDPVLLTRTICIKQERFCAY